MPTAVALSFAPAVKGVKSASANIATIRTADMAVGMVAYQTHDQGKKMESVYKAAWAMKVIKRTVVNLS